MGEACVLRRDRQQHGPHNIHYYDNRQIVPPRPCPGFRLTEQEGGPPNDAIMAWELNPAQHIGDWSEDMAEVDQKARDLQALRDWWIELAQEEFDKVGPKAIEYGAYDLIEIGKTLAYTMKRFDLTDAQRAEMGIYFYVVGKMGRWTDAIATGKEVSDDTLHDLGVYIRMAQRIRAVGAWPFLPNEEGGQQ